MGNTSLLERNADDALKRINSVPLRGKAVLLTGATGLIGVNLAAALNLAGARVTTPKRGVPPMGQYDYIIHAAGYAQPAKFMADPMATIAVNTSMLAELLGRLRDDGRLLYLSTSEVYSGNVRGLHREEDIGATNPSHARGCYIESKRCGEAIVHAARAAGREAMIARVSSVYGPGVRAKDTRVMSQFIDSAIKADEIVLQDGGQARRVFCYVSDGVEMLLNILLRGEGAVYNVGGPTTTGSHSNLGGEVSIVGLARKIGEITKARVTVPAVRMARSSYTGSALAGAPAHVGLDLGRYVREFGKENWVSLDEGLRRTVEWHRSLVGMRSVVAA